MRQLWLAFLLMAAATVFSATVSAQRFPQVINPNTHEGKFSNGGVGFAFGFAPSFGGELHREGPGSQVVGGNLEAMFKRRFTQTQSRMSFGGKLDFQIGSDNDVVGTDFGLEFQNINLSTASSVQSAGQELFVIAPGTNPVFLGGDESITVLYFGFDLTVNFFRSEFLETDGRRTRQDWGLALALGPKIGMMSGDLGDLNGFSSIGFEIGLVADVPVPLDGAEDLISFSPFFYLESNFHMPIDGGLTDTSPVSPTAGKDMLNDNFDLGFYAKSQEDLDGNGVPDYDGIALRRHDFIPTWTMNLGTTFNLTPIFVSRSGSLINNWRFTASLTMTIPINLPLFAAEYVGDAMWSSDGFPTMTLTIGFGAAYFF